MKIKLLAASVLFLALGMSTTQAQNRKKSGFEKERMHQSNDAGGFSKKDGKDHGKFNKDRKHRKDFRHDRKLHKRGSFHKTHHRSHRH